MPNDLLRLRGIIIHVDISFSDADTGKPGKQTRLHNLVSVRAGVAPNINGASCGVRSGAGTAFGLFPRPGTVCGIEHKRNAGIFPCKIQFIHCVLLHVLQ